MELLTLIRHRRSVRKYKRRPPEEEALRVVLEAGRWAPSGLNNQPWRFAVITRKDVKKGLAGFTKCGGIINDAPCLIAVFLDREASYNRDKDLMAIGAAIENMLLQIHALGLGACWLGEILHKKQDVVKFLKVDGNLELMAVVALGYPDEKNLKGSRKSLESLMIRS